MPAAQAWKRATEAQPKDLGAHPPRLLVLSSDSLYIPCRPYSDPVHPITSQPVFQGGQSNDLKGTTKREGKEEGCKGQRTMHNMYQLWVMVNQGAPPCTSVIRLCVGTEPTTAPTPE